MANLLTQPDLDAGLVERTAQAIYRAELLCLFPRHAAASAAEDSGAWKLHWQGQAARTRMSYRQQAIAALRASELLERVAELERAFERANTDLEAYAHTPDGNAWARRDVTAHLRKVHDKKIV